MALGADRGKVIGIVLRGPFRRVVAGLVLGLPLPVASLAAAAFIASIVPAARAASIAPMNAAR